MTKLKASLITREAFRPYGFCQDLYDIEQFKKNPQGESGFYPDLVSLRLGQTTLPSISISKVKKRAPIIPMLEYHKFTAEGILPLDGDCLIYVGLASREFSPDNLTAFLVPKGVFVSINPGTIHGTHFPVQEEWVRVLIILPERTYGNDTVRKDLSAEEQFEIIL